MTRGTILAGVAVLVGGVRTGEPRHARDRLWSVCIDHYPICSVWNKIA